MSSDRKLGSWSSCSPTSSKNCSVNNPSCTRVDTALCSCSSTSALLLIDLEARGRRWCALCPDARRSDPCSARAWRRGVPTRQRVAEQGRSLQECHWRLWGTGAKAPWVLPGLAAPSDNRWTSAHWLYIFGESWRTCLPARNCSSLTGNPAEERQRPRRIRA